jgi:hypothetical protein
MIHRPPSPENNIGVMSTLFCGDIRKSRCTSGINDTGGKFAPGVNHTCGKFATGVNDTTVVGNNGNNIRLITPLSELEGK